MFLFIRVLLIERLSRAGELNFRTADVPIVKPDDDTHDNMATCNPHNFSLWVPHAIAARIALDDPGRVVWVVA
jgi:hypothetical protein